ncbi:S-adenosyl-L-methionine-dependent methyltransferase [Paraphysoderma sedebokerense]|nr:S-adenosyl-L-methionine-dependent methyltransferase [Paraphysoderma sedebokerense]KAI9137761.1 S-adenosyl-L-methionine-dependent methyltransferase [Paraphysoderma sedebokerense]
MYNTFFGIIQCHSIDDYVFSRCSRRNVHIQRGFGTSTFASSPINTVDNAEIKKFSDLSSAWWDPHGEFKMLHLMNPIRVQYIRSRIAGFIDETGDSPTPFQGMKFLDIGCGGGLLSESLKRLGADTLGADASFSNIQIAQLHQRTDKSLVQPPGRLQYRNCTAEQLLEEGKAGKYDVVCAMEIIEHVNDPAGFLKVCGDLLKPKGLLFVSTISRTPLARFLTITLAEDVLKLVSSGTHDYHKYIKPEELQTMLETVNSSNAVMANSAMEESHHQDEAKSKLRLLDTEGMWFNPVLGRWELGGGANRSFIVNYVATIVKS